MKKYILNPKVVRGGKAIPLGNNFYYMQTLLFLSSNSL